MGVQSLQQWIDTNTQEEIMEGILLVLEERDPAATFMSNASLMVVTAAAEQDTIGWQNFVEGKISRKWGKLQEAHYEEFRSIHSGDLWAQGLVTQLMEFTHDMLMYQNLVSHECTANGLKKEEAEALEQAIQEEFTQGLANLSHCDQHYI